MQPLSELIQDAADMLRDRHPTERELIYDICTLNDEERTAIILAYQMLYKRDDE